MKKASPTQQKILDKMQQGYTLTKVNGGKGNPLVVLEKGNDRQYINYATFNAMYDKDLIERSGNPSYGLVEYRIYQEEI